MSNLGTYQTLTTLAKKVGGPKILAGIVFLCGFITLRFLEAGVKNGIRVTKSSISRKNNICKNKGVVCKVVIDGKDRSGLAFSVGDKYRILDCDGDAILIEKLGDINNPYFVSRDFLSSISDYNVL